MECYSCLSRKWKSVQRISQGEGGGEGPGDETPPPLPELGKPPDPPATGHTCDDFKKRESGWKKKFTVECDADSRGQSLSALLCLVRLSLCLSVRVEQLNPSKFVQMNVESHLVKGQ
jgi:hypothetical protein